MATRSNKSQDEAIAKAAEESKGQPAANPQGNLADFLARAAAAAEQGKAPAWNPNGVDDDNKPLNHPLTISGVVDDMDRLPDQFDDSGFYPVVTIDTKDPSLGDGGRFSIHAFHTAMRSQFGNIGIGDILAITYLGVTEQKNKQAGKQGYENYNVVLFNPDGSRKPVRRPQPIPSPADVGTATHPTVTGPGGAPRTGAQFGEDPGW